MIKHITIAAALAIFLAPAAHANPPIAAAGAAALGVGTGGNGGASNGSVNNETKNKTIAGAVAFPPPVQTQPCFYGVGLLWNGVSFTSYSAKCGQDQNLQAIARFLPEGSPLIDEIALAVLCANPAGRFSDKCGAKPVAALSDDTAEREDR